MDYSHHRRAMEPTIDLSMPPDDNISGDADRDEKKEHIFLDDGACECCDPEKINVMKQIQRVRSYLNSAVSAMNMLEFWIDEVEERHHNRLGKR